MSHSLNSLKGIYIYIYFLWGLGFRAKGGYVGEY